MKSDLEIDTDRGMMDMAIPRKLKEYKKKTGNWPKNTVANIMFQTVADYEEFVSAMMGNPIPKGGSEKGKLENLKDTNFLYSAATNLHILPINPKGETA